MEPAQKREFIHAKKARQDDCHGGRRGKDRFCFRTCRLQCYNDIRKLGGGIFSFTYLLKIAQVALISIFTFQCFLRFEKEVI